MRSYVLLKRRGENKQQQSPNTNHNVQLQYQVPPCSRNERNSSKDPSQMNLADSSTPNAARLSTRRPYKMKRAAPQLTKMMYNRHQRLLEPDEALILASGLAGQAEMMGKRAEKKHHLSQCLPPLPQPSSRVSTRRSSYHT